jgi:hypothetical protein
MDDASDRLELPPSLRFLKGLVITLMLVMIGGVIAIVALLVTRLPSVQSTPALPATISLPAGEVADAVTVAKGMVIVVTEAGRVLVFAPDGTLRQEIALD